MWKDIESAPRDGTPVLIKYEMRSNDLHGYAPWDRIGAVIAWWEGEVDTGWHMCFMEDGAADTNGYSSQFFQVIPESKVRLWMSLPD